MLNLVISLFLVMALGWSFRKFNLLGDGAEKVFNQYLFYLALPALIIIKIANTSFSGLGLIFIFLNCLPLAAAMLLVYGCWKAGWLDWKLARLMVIVTGLGNTAYLGFPVISMSQGAESLGYAAIVASIQNVFIFTLGFYLVTKICGGPCPPLSFRKGVLKNAVLLSSIAGLFISFVGIKIPVLLHDIMLDIGKTTLPLSLFTIGLSLYGKSLRRDLGRAFLISGVKMFFVPGVYLLLAILFGFKGMASKVTFLQLAMPVGVLNFVIAKEYDFDADLVSQSIMLSTLLLLPMLFLLEKAMSAFL